jgi:hypothetical protein
VEMSPGRGAALASFNKSKQQRTGQLHHALEFFTTKTRRLILELDEVLAKATPPRFEFILSRPTWEQLALHWICREKRPACFCAPQPASVFVTKIASSKRGIVGRKKRDTCFCAPWPTSFFIAKNSSLLRSRGLLF